MSNNVVIGPALTLPYEEHFNGTGEYGWGYASNNLWDLGQWQVSDWISYNDADGNFQKVPLDDNDAAVNLYLSSYSTKGEQKSMTSGDIALTGVENPELSLRYFNVPTGDTRLDVILITSDGEEHTVGTVMQNES